MLNFLLSQERDNSRQIKYYPSQQYHQRVCEAISDIFGSNIETLNVMNVVHKNIQYIT
jgi:hypothetical protein